MISYPQAIQTIAQHVVQPLPAERLSLLEAVGRIVAMPLVAPYDMPPFAQSMMDGYAVRSRDTQVATPTQPVRLSVGPTLTAGAMLHQPLSPGQVIRIMTGAPVPQGADTILRMEDSELAAGMLVIRQPLPRGMALQQRGAEIRRGTVLLRPGEHLTPQRIGTALSLGLESVDVIRRPRVAFMAPGDELLSPGAAWQPGKKWCSNLYALDLRVQELGCSSLNLGIVPDTLESLTQRLHQGLVADLVVILGASGRGDHDFAARAMTAVGAEALFRGVATSPGRSITVARCQSSLIFGLPGSPWAACIGFETFVWPALRMLLGQRPLLPPTQEALLTTALHVRPGVTHFVPARLRYGAEGCRATPIDTLLALARAEAHPIGLIVVPPHRRQLPSRARVRVQRLTL
jgi:molybdopterin molybdotransferase